MPAWKWKIWTLGGASLVPPTPGAANGLVFSWICMNALHVRVYLGHSFRIITNVYRQISCIYKLGNEVACIMYCWDVYEQDSIVKKCPSRWFSLSVKNLWLLVHPGQWQKNQLARMKNHWSGFFNLSICPHLSVNLVL